MNLLLLLFNVAPPWAWEHLRDKHPPSLDSLSEETHQLLGFPSCQSPDCILQLGAGKSSQASPFLTAEGDPQDYCTLIPGRPRYMGQEWAGDLSHLLNVPRCCQLSAGTAAAMPHPEMLPGNTEPPHTYARPCWGQRVAVVARQELGGES